MTAEPRLAAARQKANDEALKRIETGRRKKAEKLDLSNLGLTSLPSVIGLIDHLAILYLSHNQLESLPPEIGQLADLSILDLSYNRLTSLPPEIGRLANLGVLNVSQNRLRSLPPELGRLAALWELDLHYNELTNLPAEIGRLTELTSLLLYHNQLTGLPPEIGQLAGLTNLVLDENRLSTLPPEIGRLATLETISLENNALIELPESLRMLTRLEELTLHENAALGLPKEVLGPSSRERAGKKVRPAEPRAILDYYFTHRTSRGCSHSETGTIMGPAEPRASMPAQRQSVIPQVAPPATPAVCSEPAVASIPVPPAPASQRAQSKSHQMFIAGRRQDRDFATAICDRLRRAGVRSWFAPRDLGAVGTLEDQLPAAIRSSHLVLLVYSQAAVQSTWIRRELELARQLGKPIIPIRVDHCQIPDDPAWNFLSPLKSMDAVGVPFEQFFSDLLSEIRRVLDAPVGFNPKSTDQARALLAAKGSLNATQPPSRSSDMEGSHPLESPLSAPPSAPRPAVKPQAPEVPAIILKRPMQKPAPAPAPRATIELRPPATIPPILVKLDLDTSATPTSPVPKPAPAQPPPRPVPAAGTFGRMMARLFGSASPQTAAAASAAKTPAPAGPPPPSEGKEYAFISYKREDMPRIAHLLHRIVSWGHPIWYDAGIVGGSEWNEVIDEKVSHCQILIVFLSQAAVESKMVRREIILADKENRPILGVRLEKEVEFKHGLKGIMAQYQTIDASAADFSDQLAKAIKHRRLL